MLLFFTHCFHLEGIADVKLLYFMISICMPNSLARSSLERINPLNSKTVEMIPELIIEDLINSFCSFEIQSVCDTTE